MAGKKGQFSMGIFTKQNIDIFKDFYLKLSLSPYQDLIIERKDDLVLIGHYREENGDPILIMDIKDGYWHPLGIEQWCGDTVCSYVENGKRMLDPEKIKEFRAFQRIFAKNIKEQLWLENGNKIQEAIVCDIFFINKDAPNPFVMGKCKTDYANPYEEK